MCKCNHKNPAILHGIAMTLLNTTGCGFHRINLHSLGRHIRWTSSVKPVLLSQFTFDPLSVWVGVILSDFRHSRLTSCKSRPHIFLQVSVFRTLAKQIRQCLALCLDTGAMLMKWCLLKRGDRHLPHAERGRVSLPTYTFSSCN